MKEIIFLYTPNIKATVAPEIPGSNSAMPTKKPATKNKILSLIYSIQQALVQKIPLYSQLQ